MKTIFGPLLRRVGSFGGGMLIAAGMTQADANLVVNGAVALSLFAMDIALSRFNFLRN